MRALRALTAILLAGLAAAQDTAVSAERAFASPAQPCVEDGRTLTGVQPLPQSDTFIGSSATTSLPGAVEEGARTHAPAARVLRPAALRPSHVPAARAAAVTRDHLEYALVLHAARLGWFSFGSTAPPPFRI